MTDIRPIRILLAKIGLDGHDRGIRIVARGLREAGCEVHYAGLWQSAEAVALAVEQKEVEWLGLSVLNGAHMTQIPQVLAALKRRDLHGVGVIVGGIVPAEDESRLLGLGVEHVFGPGTAIRDIVAVLQIKAAKRPRPLSRA